MHEQTVVSDKLSEEFNRLALDLRLQGFRTKVRPVSILPDYRPQDETGLAFEGLKLEVRNRWRFLQSPIGTLELSLVSEKDRNGETVRQTFFLQREDRARNSWVEDDPEITDLSDARFKFHRYHSELQNDLDASIRR